MPDPQYTVTELKMLLLRAGIKQKDIAKKANISAAAVSLILSGKSRSARVERIIREEAAKVLGEKDDEGEQSS